LGQSRPSRNAREQFESVASWEWWDLGAFEVRYEKEHDWALDEEPKPKASFVDYESRNSICRSVVYVPALMLESVQGF
jgi:hypothetical protein